MTFGFILLTVGLLAGGRLSFTFFPAPESNRINASIQFVAGTDQAVTARFVDHVYQALRDTEAALEPGVIDTAVVAYNQGSGGSGSVFGLINVELVDSERRHTRNAVFMREWNARVTPQPGLENFNVVAQQAGLQGVIFRCSLVAHRLRF